MRLVRGKLSAFFDLIFTSQVQECLTILPKVSVMLLLGKPATPLHQKVHLRVTLPKTEGVEIHRRGFCVGDFTVFFLQEKFQKILGPILNVTAEPYPLVLPSASQQLVMFLNHYQSYKGNVEENSVIFIETDEDQTGILFPLAFCMELAKTSRSRGEVNLVPSQSYTGVAVVPLGNFTRLHPLQLLT